ncbi:MAG TPA: archaellin/type IV pilin N-terminal domain-containing protein [Candidatus Thermoplasmatota archaeon]|nr:archaellin/type IV pilin N-terminal domain-containing protein [Candidatus Thermoplasmatota archaeon]
MTGDLPLKANRASKNDRAEVGVGTLIVFIAMVLVAAVAAAVLINTAGSLQQRAQATGKEATQEVSSNLKVVNVFGVVSSNKIEDLRVVAQLSAGALPMDLERAIIRFSDGDNTFNYAWTPAFDDNGDCDGAGTPVDTGDVGVVESDFVSMWLRPSPSATNDLGCSGKSVMQPGDIVELRFSLATARAMDVRSAGYVTIMPEMGSAVNADFRTPATYGSDTYITLR